jgi:hypothetical protein
MGDHTGSIRERTQRVSPVKAASAILGLKSLISYSGMCKENPIKTKSSPVGLNALSQDHLTRSAPWAASPQINVLLFSTNVDEVGFPNDPPSVTDCKFSSNDPS